MNGYRDSNDQDQPERREHSYEAGLREGRLISLEKTVIGLTEDLSKLKIMIYMLYGAIALVQFLPDLRGLFDATSK